MQHFWLGTTSERGVI